MNEFSGSWGETPHVDIAETIQSERALIENPPWPVEPPILCQFHLAELPFAVRQKYWKLYSERDPSCVLISAVSIGIDELHVHGDMWSSAGLDLPLDERTPWGIVGDYIVEKLPDTTDNRLLARMCYKVQDATDRLAEAS